MRWWTVCWAATSVLTEKLVNLSKPFSQAFGAGATDQVVGNLIGRAVNRFAKTAGGKTALNAFLRTGASFVGEGAEEFIEAVVDPFLRRGTFDEEAKFDFESAVYDFLVGGTMGGLGGAVDTVSSAQGDYRQNREQVQTQTFDTAVNDAYDTMGREGMFSQTGRQAAGTALAQGPRAEYDSMPKLGDFLSEQQKTASGKEAVRADTSLFDVRILSNLNEARSYMMQYAKEHFPPSAVNKETGREIGISRTGLDFYA